MKFIPTLIITSSLAILAGCEEFDNAPPKPTTAPTTAPEFLRCRDVPVALSQADAIVRTPVSISSNEKAYWYDRQQRLVKRAWECKG